MNIQVIDGDDTNKTHEAPQAKPCCHYLGLKIQDELKIKDRVEHMTSFWHSYGKPPDYSAS